MTRPVVKLVQKAQREERAAAKKKAAKAKKKAAEAKAMKIQGIPEIVPSSLRGPHEFQNFVRNTEEFRKLMKNIITIRMFILHF